MEKATVGLLKTFVKMFSPILDTNLYVDEESVTKTKSTPYNRIRSHNYRHVQAGENSTEDNSTDEGSLDYSEQTNYSYAQDGDDITLENEAQIESSGDTHNSVETATESPLL